MRGRLGFEGFGLATILGTLGFEGLLVEGNRDGSRPSATTGGTCPDGREAARRASIGRPVIEQTASSSACGSPQCTQRKNR